MDATQEELIDKIRAGDRGAFQVLVSDYRAKAFSICYNIAGNLEDAKDILQEAFIKAYKNIDRFRKEASFYSWFYSILINSARDYLRKKVRQQKVFLEPLKLKDGEQPALEVADSRLGPEGLILTKELNQLLEGAIGQLPEKQRLSFIMKHISGMKVNEIAQILRCRPQTVKVHLFRAARSLREKLSPYLAPN